MLLRVIGTEVMVSPSKQQNKKVLDRRNKASPGPSNSATASGSRKTKSSSKPLANRRFYLDIKNHSSLKKLTDRLVLLGGKPELFLDKEVDYVVTDRENSHLKKRLPLDRTPTPSPLPSFCSVSPATTDSPTDGLGNKKTRSRAEAMLERVRQQPQKTTGDILDNAISWNIPVYPLPKFLTWLEKFNSKVEQNKSPNPANESIRGLKILSGCYLKVEAGNLRPDFKQFSSWPSLAFSLADKPKPLAEKIVTTPKGRTDNWSLNKTPRNELASNVPSNRMTRRVRRTKEASSVVGGGHGYCEICRTHYDQLDSHTVSAQHLKFVTDSSQYSQLDSIIQRNHLGSANLRKSLRIAKSPPPASAPSQTRMGGRHSLNGSSTSASGGATNAPGDRNLAETADMISTPVSREVARSLRLREYSVSLGPPVGPIVNGFGPAMPTKSKTSYPSNKLPSPTQVVPPSLPSAHSVNLNGCTRRSQRSRHTSETSDKEAGEDASAQLSTDRNLRSRKASSAQTPMTPPPVERLPSPPPVEKLSPPVVKSGSACERAVTRSDRCARRSEDRNFRQSEDRMSRRSEDRVSLRSEDRSPADKDHRSASNRLQEKERSSLRLKSPGLLPTAKVSSVMTRSNREPSVDAEKDARSPSPTKCVTETGPLQLKLRYRRLRCQSSKSSDDFGDSRTKRAKIDVNDDDRQSEGVDAEEELRNDRLSPIVNKSDDATKDYHQKTPKKRWQSDGDASRRKRSKRKAVDRLSSQESKSVNRLRDDERDHPDDDDGEHPDDDDRTSDAANEVPLDDWDASHDRIRTLRHKDRSHFYGEIESEDSPPSIALNSNSRTLKNARKKKSFSSKPRVTKKRLSVEEKLIEDNKSYYKVEVLNSKLRSTEYFVSQRQAEERVNGDVEGIKPVVVRFKKIRTTELALLSDEAENFMFGEPKRETDSDEEDGSRIPEDEAEPRSKSSDRLGSSSIKLETDSSQHSDLVAVKARSSCDFSSPLKIRIKQEPVESEDDEDVDVDPSTLHYLFEKPPTKEPWIEALKRQQEGTEHYIPMSHDYPKIILPYQVKRRRRKSSKKLETMSSPVKSTLAISAVGAGYSSAPPSSPFSKKSRVSRLIAEEKPRKSPRDVKKKKLCNCGCPGSCDPVECIPSKKSEEIMEQANLSCHASTLAIMSSLMKRRPVRECTEKLVSYEEESSLPETIESSGSNSNSADAMKTGPTPEQSLALSVVLRLGDFEFTPLGDKIAEALVTGSNHLDNYEPGSCLGVDPSCFETDAPVDHSPGLKVSLDEILRTSSLRLPMDEIYAQSRPFRAIRNQNDSCASSDCSDFLGYLDEDHPSTKKRKKRRNLTGWPVEKPRKKFKDPSSSGSCLLMNVRAPDTPERPDTPVTSPVSRTPSRGRGRGRGRGRPSKTSPRRGRPYLSATLPVPSPLTRTSASEHEGLPTSPSHHSSADVASLPPKKKLSRLSAARALYKF